MCAPPQKNRAQMPYQQTIQRVTTELNTTFDQLDRFFDLSVLVRQYASSVDAWCIDQILEHITLTNHFLMLTLRRSTGIALRRAKTQPIPEGESDLDTIVQIGDPDAFAWIRPEHMEPTGEKSSDEVRALLRTQQEVCLSILAQVPAGEGSLHTVRMSVQSLGKLDMYQWVYFMVQHARRHITEMERLEHQVSGP